MIYREEPSATDEGVAVVQILRRAPGVVALFYYDSVIENVRDEDVGSLIKRLDWDFAVLRDPAACYARAEDLRRRTGIPIYYCPYGGFTVERSDEVFEELLPTEEVVRKVYEAQAPHAVDQRDSVKRAVREPGMHFSPAE